MDMSSKQILYLNSGTANGFDINIKLFWINNNA